MVSLASRDQSSPAALASAVSAKNVAVSQHPAPVGMFWRIARFLGSLQFAIVTGSIFTVAMAVGTYLESRYSDKIAQELIYYSWWFVALLVMLASSIFFAAVKKWPWKKHQTGFLITHVGLLTLLAGGVVNTFGGLDASMELVDSSMAARSMRKPQRSSMAFLPNHTVISVRRPVVDRQGREEWAETQLPVHPGPLPWGTELAASSDVPGLVRVLAWLANPFPRGASKQLDGDLKIETLAHLPHTRVEPVEAAPAQHFGFPAVKVELNTKDGGAVPADWVALTSDTSRGVMPLMLVDSRNILVEFLARCEPSLLEEFLKPPPDAERGKRGQLVFVVGGTKHRLDVAAQLGKTVPLGQSGWKVTLEKYVPRPNEKNLEAQPDFPAVDCQVISPEGKATKYRVTGRLTIYPGPLDSLESPVVDLPAGAPAAWYHPPDLRYGYEGRGFDSPHIQYMLQFAQTTDNKLYYRSFIEQDGKLVLETAGEAPETGIEKQLWHRQAGSFMINEYLPHARPCEQRVVPVSARPGLVNPEIPPAMLCRVSVTKKDSQGETKTFSQERWVVQGKPTRMGITGTLDGKPFQEPVELSYGFQAVNLGFELELTRAESQVDPGTTRSATYTSFVKLYDPERGIRGEDRMITMNEPLDHRGCKVYQSNFTTVGTDPTSGKPIALSGFTIGRDPGLWLKYLGTGMVGLGIATMFYMRAYFFKPKQRAAKAVPQVSPATRS